MDAYRGAEAPVAHSIWLRIMNQKLISQVKKSYFMKTQATVINKSLRNKRDTDPASEARTQPSSEAITRETTGPIPVILSKTNTVLKSSTYNAVFMNKINP
jgi:hypothetical protein